MVREGRTTTYNRIADPGKLIMVNRDNIDLENGFIEYMYSIDRAASTIKQYQANLHIFWCWNYEYNNNKFFVNLTKREIAKFQNYAINEWKWSPKRIRTVKATLSSLSNYIETILDDEFKDYRPIINKIESPADEPVRYKTVLTEEEVKYGLDKLVERGEYEKACLFALAFYGGRRKSELTLFKTSYFDDKNLICGGALYKTPEKMKTKGRGQRGKLLDVYTLAKPFKPYLDLWMAQRKELGIESEWLFPSTTKQNDHIRPELINYWIKLLEEILGKPVYVHCARHFFCSYLLEQNLPESVVQEVIGWSSSDINNIVSFRSNASDKSIELLETPKAILATA